MEQLIPRTLRRLESYQSSLAKSAVFTQFQHMTKGQLSLTIKGDPTHYSFGYGNKVKAQMHIENERFFHRFWTHGELGFGESFVDGDWNSPNLAQVIRWFFLNVEHIEAFVRPGDAETPFMQFMLGLRYIQDVISHARPLEPMAPWASQYELERPFFQLMLDAGLNNSGALFAPGDTLEEAQNRKLRQLARELRIQPGCRVLEVGCGWGSFALYLARHYDCHVTAVTLTEEQFIFLKEQCKKEGLNHKITPVNADFRTVEGRYDRVVSVELIDAIEPSQVRDFFQHCESWLKPQGIMVHQLLLSPEGCPQESATGTPPRVEWHQKYISPGMTPPSLSQLLLAINDQPQSSFCVRRLKDIGLSYSKTLEAWRLNFEEHKDDVRILGFDERFIRSWHYYLAYAEASFDQGLITAAQITLSRATQRMEEGEGEEEAEAEWQDEP